MSDIPENMLVKCPKHWAMVSIRETCELCEHLQAIGVANTDERIPWHERHAVMCGYRRRLPIEVLKRD